MVQKSNDKLLLKKNSIDQRRLNRLNSYPSGNKKSKWFNIFIKLLTFTVKVVEYFRIEVCEERVIGVKRIKPSVGCICVHAPRIDAGTLAS